MVEMVFFLDPRARSDDFESEMIETLDPGGSSLLVILRKVKMACVSASKMPQRVGKRRHFFATLPCKFVKLVAYPVPFLVFEPSVEIKKVLSVSG